jgi:hypothetical protein
MQTSMTNRANATSPDLCRARAWWLATLPLLGAQIGGWAPGLDAAIALTVVQTVVAVRHDRTPESLAVQVRLVYLVLLIVGSVPPMEAVHVVLLAGTCAQAAFGYCPLARVLSLLPWNRRVPLSLGLLLHTAFAPPTPEGVLAQQARWDEEDELNNPDLSVR